MRYALPKPVKFWQIFFGLLFITLMAAFLQECPSVSRTPGDGTAVAEDHMGADQLEIYGDQLKERTNRVMKSKL